MTITMNKAQLEQEIALLESRLAVAKASKPAHDTTGAYEAKLLEIEDELTHQLEKARSIAGWVIVVYGEKCYFDVETGTDTDTLLAEFAPGIRRVSAKNCVDMLADEDERKALAGSDKVYWLTPGWMEYWDFIFKDWDAAKANETFPANDRAILLDAVGYYDSLSQTDPEKLLGISDWTRLQIVPYTISLERLKSLLLESAQRTETAL